MAMAEAARGREEGEPLTRAELWRTRAEAGRISPKAAVDRFMGVAAGMSKDFTVAAARSRATAVSPLAVLRRR